MPVTFQVSAHQANPLSPRSPSPLGPHRHTVEEFEKEDLHFSFTESQLKLFVPCGNGFVHGCLNAYNMHRNLVLRPDDVWIAIVTQFSSYLAGHEDEMRKYFVESKVKIIDDNIELASIDIRWMAGAFTAKLNEEIEDKDFHEWLVPKFSTTTPNDKIISKILMTGTTRNYFISTPDVETCGIPFVTLDGTKADWESLRKRLDKLLTFGDTQTHPHLHAWHRVLFPIFDNFVDCFTVFGFSKSLSASFKSLSQSSKSLLRFSKPKNRAEELVTFFQHIGKIRNNGSERDHLQGWLTFFCAFNKKGKWQLLDQDIWGSIDIDPRIYGKAEGEVDEAVTNWIPLVEEENIPSSRGRVIVNFITKSKVIIETIMDAGMVGYEAVGDRRDTIQPTPGWWMFVWNVKYPS